MYFAFEPKMLLVFVIDHCSGVCVDYLLIKIAMKSKEKDRLSLDNLVKCLCCNITIFGQLIIQMHIIKRRFLRLYFFCKNT